MPLRKVGFTAFVEKETNHFGMDTKDANFQELCGLLGLLELIKGRLIDHLKSLSPEYQIEDTGGEND